MRSLRVFAILLCLLVAGSGRCFAEFTADEALSEFVAAGMAYKEGRYDEAIVRYKKILEGRRVSGPLYYNLGNSYFKKKNIGKTVLNYERAKKIIPRDSDLNFNDRYVRSKVDRKLDTSEKDFFDRLLGEFIRFYTIDEMVIILFGIGLVIGVVFLILPYVRLTPSTTRVITGLFILSFLIYGGGLMAKVNSERNLAVIMSASDTFFEPRTDSTVHFELPEGARVRILKSEGSWIKIERLDGKVGWVDSKALEKI